VCSFLAHPVHSTIIQFETATCDDDDDDDAAAAADDDVGTRHNPALVL